MSNELMSLVRFTLICHWIAVAILIGAVAWSLKVAFDITAAVNKPWEDLAIGAEPAVMEMEMAIEWARMQIWWQWVAVATAASLVVLTSLCLTPLVHGNSRS